MTTLRCDKGCGAIAQMTGGYHSVDCALSIALGRPAAMFYTPPPPDHEVDAAAAELKSIVGAMWSIEYCRKIALAMLTAAAGVSRGDR